MKSHIHVHILYMLSQARRSIILPTLTLKTEHDDVRHDATRITTLCLQFNAPLALLVDIGLQPAMCLRVY